MKRSTAPRVRYGDLRIRHAQAGCSPAPSLDSAGGRASLRRIGGGRTVVGSLTRREPRDAVDLQRVHCSDVRIRHSHVVS